MLVGLIAMILLPFAGTVIGAVGVFFVRKTESENQRALSAFAAGVMTAACVWSLIIPSVEGCADMGRLAFLPCLAGIFSGTVFTVFLENRVQRMKNRAFIMKSGFSDSGLMTFLAVTIHNFPEGLAVGLMCASALGGDRSLFFCAFAFSVAIALQTIPEGAIISLPMHNEGKDK